MTNVKCLIFYFFIWNDSQRLPVKTLKLCGLFKYNPSMGNKLDIQILQDEAYYKAINDLLQDLYIALDKSTIVLTSMHSN